MGHRFQSTDIDTLQECCRCGLTDKGVVYYWDGRKTVCDTCRKQENTKIQQDNQKVMRALKFIPSVFWFTVAWLVLFITTFLTIVVILRSSGYSA